MWFSTTAIAKMEGVTTQTIRNRVKEGFYPKTKRTEGGHLRIFIQQQRRICYARVSSKKQQKSISYQKKRLLRKYPEAEFISDTASAFNFKRKGLQAILESAISGNPVHLVVTHQDRLARSGFPLFQYIVESSGGTIEVLDKQSKTHDTFDTDELIGFITSFCNSHYGKRSAKKYADHRNEKDQNISSK